MFSKKQIRGYAITLLFIWAGAYLAFCITSLVRPPESPTQQTNAIVVLTGGNFRLQTGFDLWAQQSAPNLFITGVHPHVTMAQLQLDWKENNKEFYILPECCAALGHKATSTRQNASETRQWARDNNISSIRLVTSGYHMHRALLEFKAAMPDITILAHPVEKPDYGPGDLKFWSITFSEYHKSLFRYLGQGLSWLGNSFKSA